MFEILIPLTLIIVLLMCMMNNTDEDSFSVGSQCNSRIEEGFTPGDWDKSSDSKPSNSKPSDSKPNSGKDQCKITMVWADWCGFSKKAKPEWDSLVSEYQGKVIDGCTVTFEDAEEKVKPDIIKKFKTTGFPTYYCEMDDKVEEFNSIKKEDMLEKIKNAIAKMKGSGNNVETLKIGGQNAPKLAPKPEPKPAPKLAPKPVPKPTIEGELLYSSCEGNNYGPVRLGAVDRNLAGVGNSLQQVTGRSDCTELEFAPIKYSTGGPQIPSKNSLMPSGAQLKAPPPDGVQGITRPSSFDSPLQ